MPRVHSILRQDAWGGGAAVFASRRAPRQASRSFCVPCLAADDAGSLLEPFERVRRGASAVVHVPRERREFLESLFRELASATSAERPAAPHAVQRSLLTLVLNEVSAAATWADAGLEPAGVAMESLRFIERNCLRPLTLNEVARAVGKTPAYVTTTLSRATGRSAVEWIIAGRMAEARRILRCRSDTRLRLVQGAARGELGDEHVVQRGRSARARGRGQDGALDRRGEIARRVYTGA